MNDFKFMIPQTIEFGVGALKKLPEIMKENDLDHVFLISDHGLEALGVVKKIQDIVEEAGLQCTTYLDIQANPTSAIVADATDKYRECGASSIIALGGDTVDINFETGAVTLNGAVLEEPYISAPTTTGYDVEFPVTVPEGCVFVMGDNRPRSLDGRSTEVGFIDERDILGKVLLRVFPLSSFGKIA